MNLVILRVVQAASRWAAGIRGSQRGVGWMALGVALTMGLAGRGAGGSEEADRTFTLQVLPLFTQKCFACHGSDLADIKGGFSMASREHLLAGGESGEPAVVPGQIEQGLLLPAVRWDGLEMPPKENDRLTELEIGLISAWIAEGAVWPDEATQARIRSEADAKPDTAAGVRVATSGGATPEWTSRRYREDDLWAFRPVASLTAAELRQIAAEAGRPLSEQANGQPAGDRLATAVVDALIQRKLDAAGLEPAPRAEPETLIRRATFDLHGLPPTPEEVEAFVAAFADQPEAAWAALIERLLASPRYGERWGRHWLDVTRYADTGGMSNDYERSNMWRYRDYVIRSFNRDTPYDEFVMEQIAGDELADQSVRERLGDDDAAVHAVQQSGNYTEQEAEWIVATGFLRLGPWDNAMVEKAEARQIWLDDLVNITGQAFLSTTMRCVKCHDHKFDPIPTRDYYRMMAAFATTQMAERPVPFLAEENREGFETGRAHVERMLGHARAERDRLVAKREAAARAWYAERGLPYQSEQSRKNLPDEEKPPRHVGLDYVDEGQLKVREQDVWIWERRLERYEPMAQSVYNAADFELAWNGARKLRIKRPKKPSEPPVTHILLGGGLAAVGEAVAPGVLSGLALATDAVAEDPFLLTDAVEGRRLGLARWIADPANPLTARSIVNRIWQGHFGIGLAANPNNFGATGGKPSHPQLLDFLAATFVKHGWTIKRMHRLIMQTEAYQRSSAVSQTAAWQAVDPGNRLLSHVSRRQLTAEEIRDGMLLVSGELQHTRGGVPIMPEINMEVALQPRMIQFSIAPAYQPSPTPNERNCRSVYAYQIRGQADPFMELFNQPNPNESCEVRDASAVSPQALTLLNSQQVRDRAMAFAVRLTQEAEDPEDQIRRAISLAFGRSADVSEVERLGQYWLEMLAFHEGDNPVAIEYPTVIDRSLVEEFSGKVFPYQEILPVFEHYQPDLRASDVDAPTRALADVCLLLFNANEFHSID
jgi:mono/diheme cytochrome c family protein